MKIEAIAVDIDGTITDTKRRLCIDAIKALRDAEKLGIKVTLVTGNILCYAYATSTLIGLSGGVVAENGGVIYVNDEVNVLGDIKKAKKAYNYLKSIYHVEKVQFSELRVSEIAIKRTIPVKIIKDALKDFDVEVYDTKFAIHLTDPKVDKGSSLKILTKKLGIDLEKTIAIGDSENDLEFLDVAGVKVAVANANKELKEIADYVTKKPYGSGVAEAIKKYVTLS